jgi:hypothetical protein
MNVGTSAFSSGTTATYTLQTLLFGNSTYYWESEAIDPAGSNTWSGFQSSPYKFTTLPGPVAATNCVLNKANDNSSITFTWVPLSTDQNGFGILKSTDGAAFTTLTGSLGAGTTGYVDSSVSSGHTYQYQVAPFYTGPIYGNWCQTATLNLSSPSPPPLQTNHFYIN